MERLVSLDKVYQPSEDVVAREVAGEFIIIPIASGVGELEDEIFSLNAAGKGIWDKLSAKKSLRDVALELFKEFEAPLESIEKDCVGLIQELLKKKIVVKK
jgi:Coenzyme PQQ synthesis protein D (PqqD)